MKKILIIACTLFLALPLFAQEDKANDNKQMISISAFMDVEMDIPVDAKNILKDRMTKAILKNGLSSTEGERFIMIAGVNELGKETTATAPVMHVVELEVTFYIGDAIAGTLFSQGSTIVKGADESESKAYLSALKKIKVTDPVFKKMIAQAKDNIINYYNAKCDAIIAEALKQTKNQEFDIALSELSKIPNECEECYNKSTPHFNNIYQQKIDFEGTMLLTNARNEWIQGQNIDAANKAGEFLVQINPQSSAYKEADELLNKIGKHILEFENREWNFKMKQYQDEIDFRNQQHQDEVNYKMTKIQNKKDVKLTRLSHRHYNINAILNWLSSR